MRRRAHEAVPDVEDLLDLRLEDLGRQAQGLHVVRPEQERGLEVGEFFGRDRRGSEAGAAVGVARDVGALVLGRGLGGRAVEGRRGESESAGGEQGEGDQELHRAGGEEVQAGGVHVGVQSEVA